nr:hypothetical protein [Castellaniella sp.]
MDRDGETTLREATNITPYLTVGENVVVEGQRKSRVSGLPDMLLSATCPWMEEIILLVLGG